MNTLKELIKNPATIVVDVRSPMEFETGHITGSINIPLEDIAAKAEAFRSFKSPAILYCRSGMRSGMAVNILKQNGIANVYNGGGLGDLQFLLN